MPALANVYFKDLFTEIDPGLLPSAISVTGTLSGSAIQIGGLSPWGKLLFDLTFAAGSISGSVAMWLATASASGGAFASLSATLLSIATTLSLSEQYNLKLDTRGEFFCNLGTTSVAPTWVQVVISITGSTVVAAMKCLGWEAGADPASSFLTITKPQTGYLACY
jgi:hypothetical protein